MLSFPFILFLLQSNIILFDDYIFINKINIDFSDNSKNLNYEIFFDNKTIIGYNTIFNDYYYNITKINNSKNNKEINYNKSEKSFIYCSIYDFESPIFENYNKNNIIIIGEHDNFDNNSTRNEKENRIDFDFIDYSKYLMHNKYCISRQYLITGSTNPTNNGIYKNNNNLILFKFNNSKPLKIFNKKIQFVNKLQFIYIKNFISIIKNKTFNYVPEKLKFNNINITPCFSPENNCQNLIIKKISQYDYSKILAFSFTDKNIFYNLNNSNIIIEKSKRNKYTIDKINIKKVEFLDENFNSRINIFNDNNKYNMHNKLFIFNSSIITGSYNPTGNAQKNNENILIIESYNISQIYDNYFLYLLDSIKNNQ